MLNPLAPVFDYPRHRFFRRMNPCAFTPFNPFELLQLPKFPAIQIQDPLMYTYNNFVFNFPAPSPAPSFLTTIAAVNNNDEFQTKENKQEDSECCTELAVEMNRPVEKMDCKEITSVEATYGRFGGRRYMGSFRGKKSLIWRPKVQRQNDLTLGSTDFKEFPSADERRSTVMICNIPNRFRKMMIELLDKHCAEENDNAKDDSSFHPSEYDFLYVPYDFKNRCNLGYAFVNFTNSSAPLSFYQAYQDHKWEVFGSKKICQIKYAKIQGKEALVENFKGSNFRCHTDDYLPVVFSPARNGCTNRPDPATVGSREDPR